MIVFWISCMNVLHAGVEIFHSHWRADTTPTVVICQDSELDTQLVKESIEYMARRYEIKFPDKIQFFRGDCPKHLSKRDHNHIFFRDFEQDYRYAYTGVKWTKDGDEKFIDYATVYFPNDIARDIKTEILRHEIGHALGLAHNPHDNIMLP